MTLTDLRKTVLDDIHRERNRQIVKHGIQRHDNGTWLMILGEEYGEVCQAMQTGMDWGKETDADNLYTELIHVAAVAAAIAEQVYEESHKED